MKRLFFLTILFGLFFGLWVRPVQAAVFGDIGSYIEACHPDAETNLCPTTVNTLGSLLSGIAFFSVGGETADGLAVVEDSLVGDATKTMAFMYEKRPANTATYVADLLKTNFGLVDSAYAQDTRGLGFAGLEPVLQMWKAFRNITYFLFVIFLVVVGFMVMFRAQINPQTVVTLQAALPRVVVTLLLITFSYAIAGLLVDMIFFSIYVVAGVFELAGLLVNGQAAAEAILSRTIFGIGFRYFIGIGEAAGRVAYGLNLLVREVFSSVPVVGEGAGTVIGGISSVFGYLIAAVAIVIAVVRTFFALLKSYINLILNVITAPFQILFNAFPGSNAFTNWFKKIATDALVFPAVATMILIGIILMGYSPAAGGALTPDIEVTPGSGFNRNALSLSPDKDPGGFVPPFVIPGNSGTADVLQAIIGFGIIMLLPEVVDMVKKAMGVEESPWGELSLKNANVAGRTAGQAGGIVMSGALHRVGEEFVAPRFMALGERFSEFGRRRRGIDEPTVTRGGASTEAATTEQRSDTVERSIGG